MTWCCLDQQLHSYSLGKKSIKEKKGGINIENYRKLLCWYRFLVVAYLQTSLSGKKNIAVEYCPWVALRTGTKKWRAICNLGDSSFQPLCLSVVLHIYQFLCLSRAAWILVFASLCTCFTLSCLYLTFTAWGCTCYWIKASLTVI